MIEITRISGTRFNKYGQREYYTLNKKQQQELCESIASIWQGNFEADFKVK